MRVSFAAALVAFTFLASSALCQELDGPFGVPMGASPRDFECSQLNNLGFFECNRIPRRHPDIIRYVVQSYPETGICWIQGLTSEIDTDSFGASLRLALTRLSAQITEIYGHGKLNEGLFKNSLWDEPQYWMMGLLRKERVYFYTWDIESGSTLKNGIESIYVGAKPTSTNRGFVAIEFSFRNYNECERLERKARAGAF